MYYLSSLRAVVFACDPFHRSDTLSKEEFHLKQNVEPFIHYKEKHTIFECITRENIEAVASKVSSNCYY